MKPSSNVRPISTTPARSASVWRNVIKVTIKSYLKANATAKDGSGLFIVGQIDSNGSDIQIYHVADVGDPTFIMDIASLGADFNMASLTADNFLV